MKFIVIAVLCTLAVNLCLTVEISSKIDLDSDEQWSTTTSSDKSDPLVLLIENSNSGTQHVTNSRGSSGGTFRGANTNFRGLARPTSSRNNYPRNIPPPPRSPTINNILIIIDGKENSPTVSKIIECKDNVCETTVATDTDEEGNVINSVRLTVVTKTENFKVEDVPVIDGIRGSGYNRSPTFTFNNERATPYPHFLDNNIPPIPVNRQNQPSGRHFFRPHSGSFYPRNFGYRKDSWNPWLPERSSIDDKIEPPLSKTEPNEGLTL